jgi:NADP-dependent 3-hydroxy acid dehydrogenase YdfG
VVARDAGGLARVVSETRGSSFAVDRGDAAALANLIPRVEGEAGPLDFLVNNAGVAVVDRLVYQSPKPSATALRSTAWRRSSRAA